MDPVNILLVVLLVVVVACKAAAIICLFRGITGHFVNKPARDSAEYD